MKIHLLFNCFTAFFITVSFAATRDLSKLTPAELQEYQTAQHTALRTPAVQSTRRIARMALHKAMLKADPTVDTIFANMNAHAPKNQLQISQRKKHFGMKFTSWLANYPPESVSALTKTDLKKLEIAHAKGLQDPSVIAARKTARITFYNAMINTDPKIIPILTKAGIEMPQSIRTPTANSKIGNEEQILGGNDDLWDTEVLAPAVEQMKKN
ncbi:MAG: hypothetical protein FJ390_00485 [Verrucomicrobia bacterium]|nr:hypothetical protein [Verrucomicrobiota bacterium]